MSQFAVLHPLGHGLEAVWDKELAPHDRQGQLKALSGSMPFAVPDKEAAAQVRDHFAGLAKQARASGENVEGARADVWQLLSDYFAIVVDPNTVLDILAKDRELD